MSRITLASADFSASRDYLLPVSTNAEYFNFFRGGADNLPRNLVPSKPAVSVAGAPTIGAGFATFTGQSVYLTTGLDDPSNYTYLAVIKAADDATGKIAIGNYAGPILADLGSALYIPGNASLVNMVGLNNSGAAVNLQSTLTATSVETEWLFVVARSDGSNAVIRNVTKGTSNTLAMSYPRALNARKVRIGSGYTVDNVGDISVAFAGIYSRALTDVEVTQIYDRVKKAVALDGIVV